MKPKKIFTLLVDLIMTVLFVMMFSYRAISPAFHEIGGIVLFFVFVVHCILNWTWFKNVSKHLFSGRLPKKTVVEYITMVLLAVGMVFVILSGILISKVVLTGITSASMVWRGLHVPVSIAMLVVMGVHIGLAWGNVIKAVPGHLPKALSYGLALALLAAGGFGAYAVNIPQKMTMNGEHSGGYGVTQSGSAPSGTPANTSGSKPTGTPPSGAMSGSASGSSAQKPSGTPPTGFGPGNGKHNGSGRGAGKGDGSGGVANIAWYTAFMGGFGVIAYYLDKLAESRRKKRLAA